MDQITISIAYADDERQHYGEYQVPQGSTIYQVLAYVDWLGLADFAEWCRVHQHSEPIQRMWYVGIYSQKKRLDTVLTQGDRIEIYRPLNDDPMARRKSRSKRTRQLKVLSR